VVRSVSNRSWALPAANFWIGVAAGPQPCRQFLDWCRRSPAGLGVSPSLALVPINFYPRLPVISLVPCARRLGRRRPRRGVDAALPCSERRRAVRAHVARIPWLPSTSIGCTAGCLVSSYCSPATPTASLGRRMARTVVPSPGTAAHRCSATVGASGCPIATHRWRWSPSWWSALLLVGPGSPTLGATTVCRPEPRHRALVSSRTALLRRRLVLGTSVQRLSLWE
jgi:hypothetical protein